MTLTLYRSSLVSVFVLMVSCLYGQTTIYSENFSGQNDKGAKGGTPSIIIDTSGVTWSVDTTNVNFQDSLDYIQVVTERIEFRDTEGNAKWSSPAINISNLDSIKLSIDLLEVGTMEASDSIAVYYKIDAGAETLVYSITDDFSSHTITDTLLSGTGTTLYIIVHAINGADTEKHRIDNVSVKASCGSNPSESTNFAASSTNNSASLTWTTPICADEVLVVAKLSSTISGTPSGNGSSYTAVSDFNGAGTAFDGGKVVYKGTGTSVTVTNLGATSTYYYKIWSRTGTNWSTGAEISATTVYVPNLIIAEVADPSDDVNARFVELYNADTVTIDFSTVVYNICKETNGGGSFNCTQLTGSLKPGNSYVVANSSSGFNSAFGRSPDATFGNIAGNGDDGYFLYVGGDNTTGNLLDAFGVVGTDGSGQAWEYTDSRAYRDSNHATTNATWTASEWTISSSAASGCKPYNHPSAFPQITLHSSASISGGTYRHMTINGSSIIVTANADISVIDNLNLTNGLLNLNGNKITLGTEVYDCTIGNGGSTSYLYGGTMRQYTNDSTGTYDFHLGSSSTEYSPAQVNFSSSTLASTAYIETTVSDSKHPNFGISVTGYLERNWTVEATGITNPVYTIQLDYVDGDIIGSEAALMPVKYSGGSWTAPGEIGNNNVDTVGSGSVNVASNRLTWSGVTSFSIFGGAGDGVPLPVNLVYFNGIAKEKAVELQWKTSSEINNDYFIVEKIEQNSTTQIGVIEGNGTSNESRTYTINDLGPKPGTNYYRLIQVDFDGKRTAKNVILVDVPNTNEELNTTELVYDAQTNQLMIRNSLETPIIRVIGIDGKLVQFEIEKLSDFDFSVDLNHVPQGAYIGTVTYENKQPIHLKFIR